MVSRKSSVPTVPVGRNQPRLRAGLCHPARRSFFADRNREGRGRDGLQCLPLIEACRQSFGDGFSRLQTQKPMRWSRGHRLPRIPPSGLIDNSRAVLACDVQRTVTGAVINDDDVIAGVDHLERPAQPERVVMCVDHGGDRGHDSRIKFNPCRMRRGRTTVWRDSAEAGVPTATRRRFLCPASQMIPPRLVERMFAEKPGPVVHRRCRECGSARPTHRRKSCRKSAGRH